MTPKLLLHLEGGATAALAVLLYVRAGGGWLLFAVLILAPDLSMFGYVLGPRLGSAVYNAVHNLVLPLALAAAGLLLASQPAVWVALIWTAHIGADRLLGFGLKYPTEFKDTHLARVQDANVTWGR
jgi:hypothetical protein